MKTIKKQLTLLLILFLSYTAVRAQSGLEIKKVFDEYGTKKGVVMVELKGNVLDDYGFKIFKSLSISNIPEAGDMIRNCLAKDEAGAKKVKQIVSNGKATSVILQLSPKNETNRLILFNENMSNPPKITLVYIESDDNADEVLKLVLKKK